MLIVLLLVATDLKKELGDEVEVVVSQIGYVMRDGTEAVVEKFAYL